MLPPDTKGIANVDPSIHPPGAYAGGNILVYTPLLDAGPITCTHPAKEDISRNEKFMIRKVTGGGKVCGRIFCKGLLPPCSAHLAASLSIHEMFSITQMGCDGFDNQLYSVPATYLLSRKWADCLVKIAKYTILLMTLQLAHTMIEKTKHRGKIGLLGIGLKAGSSVQQL